MSYCVAIVGRANVGKSSLFNALYGQRVAIVDPAPGITRDRISREMQLSGGAVELVDTGGVGMESAEELIEDVELQIGIAISRADLILFVVDALKGMHPHDRTIADRLRVVKKDVMVVANKADDVEKERSAAEFFQLGLGEPLTVSTMHNRGLAELKERISAGLPEGKEDRGCGQGHIKLAVVGQRNAGKSTLINYLAGESRVVVSEMPGTTRDSVDTEISFRNGDRELKFVVIDTAGVRKKKQLRESVDYYSQVRTHQAVVRADVAVHMIDARRPVSKVDKQLGSMILENYKPAILAINKIDTVPKETENGFIDYIWETLPGMRFVPVIFTSGKTGENIFTLLGLAHKLYQQAGMRVKTSRLNEAVEDIVSRRPPPSRTNKKAKILFVTQVETRPPTIAVFTNDSADITDSYRRYMSNELREVFPYRDVPVKLVVRRRRSGKNEG